MLRPEDTNNQIAQRQIGGAERERTIESEQLAGEATTRYNADELKRDEICIDR